jgi:hypothetical protein
MGDDSLLEPFDLFKKELKDKHSKNAADYFDTLVKQAGVNPEKNKETVKEYNQAVLDCQNAAKKSGSAHFLKGFLIFLTVLAFGGCVTFIVLSFMDTGSFALWLKLVLAAVLAGLGVFLIFIIKNKVSALVKKRDAELAALTSKRDALLAECWNQMNPLNELYDWNLPAEVIKITTPLIQLDKYFDINKFAYMAKKYDLSYLEDEFRSIHLVQSGSILGNPFFIKKDMIQQTIQKTYTGSLTITWTETRRDSEGHMETVHHTETLYANVTKPAPAYHYETYLIYANDAAPALSFSRQPRVSLGQSDKSIAKTVERDERKIHKASEEAVDDNGHQFTEMWNPEFESLFHALDRDNEVQFRLLFTPLAQKNELTLIKSKEPYGDDFSFTKRKQLNVIYSWHSQSIDYSGDPAYFNDYDLENAKKKFIDYNNLYFQGLYFDMLPLLSIPLYQQNKPKEYIYDEGYSMNISPYEQEAMANAFDVNLFKPENAATDCILKASFLAKEGQCDRVKITAHAFTATNMVDYVSVHGGDGRFHQVPVNWVKYDPVEKDTLMEIKKYEVSRNKYKGNLNNGVFMNTLTSLSKNHGFHFERHLLALVLNSNLTQEEISKLEEITKE